MQVDAPKFHIGDRVTKSKGSSWTGRVVGTYSTALTPEGYAVESETETGSVQIYPAAALTAYESARSAADIGALVAGITDEKRHSEMWGVRAPTSRQEATAMQIVAERWFAENGGSPARSTEPVAIAHGPKTEAVIRRDGFFIAVEWWRFGKHLSARVYEPQGMKLSPALADLLALALEDRPAIAHPTPEASDV